MICVVSVLAGLVNATAEESEANFWSVKNYFVIEK